MTAHRHPRAATAEATAAAAGAAPSHSAGRPHQQPQQRRRSAAAAEERDDGGGYTALLQFAVGWRPPADAAEVEALLAVALPSVPEVTASPYNSRPSSCS